MGTIETAPQQRNDLAATSVFVPRGPGGREITRRFVFHRQQDHKSAPLRQWWKRGEKNQAIGISRGGRTTKIHAAVDSKGRPLNFTLTGGQVHDSQVLEEVLDTPRPPLAVNADKVSSDIRN